jgi:hypothetical protein
VVVVGVFDGDLVGASVGAMIHDADCVVVIMFETFQLFTVKMSVMLFITMVPGAKVVQ